MGNKLTKLTNKNSFKIWKTHCSTDLVYSGKLGGVLKHRIGKSKSIPS